MIIINKYFKEITDQNISKEFNIICSGATGAGPLIVGADPPVTSARWDVRKGTTTTTKTTTKDLQLSSYLCLTLLCINKMSKLKDSMSLLDVDIFLKTSLGGEAEWPPGYLFLFY